MRWFSRNLAQKPARNKVIPTQKRYRPIFDLLEDRLVPSTVSAIAKDFNSTPIAAGNTIYFNGSFSSVSGLPKNATTPTTIHVVNQTIDFTANGIAYHLNVPNGIVVYTPGATSAAASYDPGDSDWDIDAPASYAGGDVFMTGLSFPVNMALPGSIKDVTWTAEFWSDTAGVTVNWMWSAAVYKPGFSSDYNALNVKPVDSNSLSVYHNGDQSGTPEAFKSFVVKGALGGGGTNYTGNFTAAKSVKPTLGDGMQDYPYPSSNPRTSVGFNESTVLKGATMDLINGTFQIFYNDEHALALGVSQVNVKTSSGITTTNYPVTPFTPNLGETFDVALDADVGSQITSGAQAGTDLSDRPMFPSLFITDITTDPNSRSGDWQFGGTAISPDAVFGTWKSVVKTVDNTTSTPTVTVTCLVDPAKNNWVLGPGSDPVPVGLGNEGYGAEVRWSLADLQSRGLIVPGHTYRFYIIVHDGDQNKTGGDCGQASFTYFFPGVTGQTATISGTVFKDANNDGLFGPGDTAPDSRILMSLIDANGNTVQTVWTDFSTGSYQFTDVPEGTYTIVADMSSFLGGGKSRPGTGAHGSPTPFSNSITDIQLNAGDTGINFDFLGLITEPGT